MLPDPCRDRRSLAQKVSLAAEEVAEARARYESARGRNADSVFDLQTALNAARDKERTAVQSLRDHIESHGCVG
jgi:hypothetical protein